MDNVLEIILGYGLVFTFVLCFIKLILMFSQNDVIENRKYIKPTDIVLSVISGLIKIVGITLFVLFIYAIEDIGEQVDVNKIPDIYGLCIFVTSLFISVLFFDLIKHIFTLINMVINYVLQRRKSLFNSLIENINEGDSKLAVDNYKIIRQSNKSLNLGKSEWVKLLSYLVIENEEDEAKFLANNIVKNKVIKKKGRFNKTKRLTQ